jgi:hypothetical protein
MVKKISYWMIIILIIFSFNDCASSKNYSDDRKRTSLMMQNNTDMSINQKYYSKHNQSVKRKSSRSGPK